VKSQIPPRLVPHFQEYDVAKLRARRDADLIIQRTLEFGTWDEIRWLFRTYGAGRIRRFIKERGERWLSRVTFNYWLKFLKIRRWKKSPFGIPRGVLWPR